MRAAFEAGADIVELDIHPTTDGHFAVFHDWTLDCRTDGKGVTREHSLADLKTLDVGHGYSADGGKTFPLRGKGVGAMPTLDEVLAAFPGKGFFIHIKSRDRSEGEKLAARLKRLAPEERVSLAVYGASEPVEEVKRQLPDLYVGARGALKDCLLGYIATGWFGRVPEACRGRVMLVPANVAPWLWGWPNRFMARMKATQTAVFILGDYDGGDFSTGIDSPEDLASCRRTSAAASGPTASSASPRHRPHADLPHAAGCMLTCRVSFSSCSPCAAPRVRRRGNRPGAGW